MLTPRMQMIHDTLKAACDANDEFVIAACRRLILANTIARNDEQTRDDNRLVLDFYRDALWTTK